MAKRLTRRTTTSDREYQILISKRGVDTLLLLVKTLPYVFVAYMGLLAAEKFLGIDLGI